MKNKIIFFAIFIIIIIMISYIFFLNNNISKKTDYNWVIKDQSWVILNESKTYDWNSTWWNTKEENILKL